MSEPTTSSLAFLVLGAPIAFVAVAAVAAMARTEQGLRPQRVERMGIWAAWGGVVVAVASAAIVAFGGAVESPTIGISNLGLSIRLDALSTIMITMIALLGVVIFRYSVTYLDGDPRQGVFLGRLALTLAAVEVLVTAGNLAVLLAAWIGTSLALHRLLVFYPERRRATIAARKKFLVARIGDVFLVVATLLLFKKFGTGNLEAIFEAARQVGRGSWSFGALEAAAVCLCFAALLKSAQFPTHGWLVEVMETPTPVSALLHAGILNAGPFLAIRMAFVIDDAPPARTLLIAVGGFTALFGSVVLLTQPSVKAGLAYSSVAHMGFMLMVCGMGAYPAALLHLVAHSFYKAHAFLSSGSAIDEVRADKVSLPARLGSPIRIATSGGIALGLYFALAALWRVNPVSDPVVFAIGAILVLGTSQIIAPALDSEGGLAGTVRAGLLAAGVTTSFFALESGVHHLLRSTVPDGAAADLVQLAVIAATVTAFTAVVLLQILEPSRAPSRRRRALAIHLRNGLYANALLDRAVGALHTKGAAR